MPVYDENEKQKNQRQTAFIYHAPKENQPDRYTNIRDLAGELSAMLNRCCPESRELSLAQTNLEQVVMWANAAIARNEK